MFNFFSSRLMCYIPSSFESELIFYNMMLQSWNDERLEMKRWVGILAAWRKNRQSLSLISSLKLILWLSAFLNACLPLIPKTVHLLKMYLFVFLSHFLTQIWTLIFHCSDFSYLQALSDPYFSGLSNSERETSTQPISKLEFDFERKS